MRGERAEARRFFEEAASIADRLGLPNLVWIVGTNQVLDAVLDGDLEREAPDAGSLIRHRTGVVTSLRHWTSASPTCS